MDRKFLEIAERAPHSCWVIVGNPATRDFAVFPVLPTPEMETLAEYAARGFVFVGCVAIVDGAPQTRLAVPLDAEALGAVMAQTIRLIEEEVERRLAEPPIAERATAAAFDSYMRHLMNLPDTRTDA